MKRRKRETPPVAGLTLLEVVLALGLLGLILTALLAVSSSGFSAWLDSREVLSEIRRETNWTDQLRSSLVAMLPMVVPATPADGASVFFQGEPRAMRFVTAHSPALRGQGGIRLVSLLASGHGRDFSLELTDAPCADLRRLGQILAEPIRNRRPTESVLIHSRRQAQTVAAVVAEGVAECNFRYLYHPARATGEPRWVSRWSDAGALPQAVRIEWTAGRDADSSINVPERSMVITASVLAAAAPTALAAAARQSAREPYAFD